MGFEVEGLWFGVEGFGFGVEGFPSQFPKPLREPSMPGWDVLQSDRSAEMPEVHTPTPLHHW